jgi:hypothetical protein
MGGRLRDWLLFRDNNAHMSLPGLVDNDGGVTSCAGVCARPFIYRDRPAFSTSVETLRRHVQLLYLTELPLIAPSQSERLTPI